MTKKELFKKFSIDDTHMVWDYDVDNWMSVEVYRIMNDGNLPKEGNNCVKFVYDFLSKIHDVDWWGKNVMSRNDWGSLYLTAKRMAYKHADEYLNQLKNT